MALQFVTPKSTECGHTTEYLQTPEKRSLVRPSINHLSITANWEQLQEYPQQSVGTTQPSVPLQRAPQHVGANSGYHRTTKGRQETNKQ